MKFFFAWYDLWIGAYWDRHGQALYICPLPMFVIRIRYLNVYRYLTWATLDEACAEEGQIAWYKKLARKWLPEPKPRGGGNWATP